MKPKKFDTIAVGQPYERSLEGEGAEFTWEGDHLELVMTFNAPSRYECEAIESGVFEIGLNVVEQIPILCFRVFQLSPPQRFESSRKAVLILPWQECPFHLAQADPERFPAFDTVQQQVEFRLSVVAVLTDLSTTRVSALRQFSLSHFFSRSLVNALLKTFPCYTSASYPEAIGRVFATFPLNTIGDTARIRCKSDDRF